MNSSRWIPVEIVFTVNTALASVLYGCHVSMYYLFKLIHHCSNVLTSIIYVTLKMHVFEASSSKLALLLTSRHFLTDYTKHKGLIAFDFSVNTLPKNVFM